MPPDSKFV